MFRIFHFYSIFIHSSLCIVSIYIWINVESKLRLYIMSASRPRSILVLFVLARRSASVIVPSLLLYFLLLLVFCWLLFLPHAFFSFLLACTFVSPSLKISLTLQLPRPRAVASCRKKQGRRMRPRSYVTKGRVSMRPRSYVTKGRVRMRPQLRTGSREDRDT